MNDISKVVLIYIINLKCFTMEILKDHWAEIALAVLALLKVIVNLTPTEKDNKVFGWMDSLINAIIPDRRNG